MVSEIELNKLTSIDLVVERLRHNGVVIIPNYISLEVIRELNEEFEIVLNSPNKDYIKKIDYSNGRGVIVSLYKIPSLELPVTKSVFSSNYMNEISQKYLMSDFALNSDIYVVNDILGTKHHANDLHFDVTPTFKFFIYLTDTTKENGAFSCVPGSHKKAEELRKELGDKISYENRELSRQLPVTEEEVISIEGVAGTLIIFDTDVFHRAGIIHSGERRVMRGHTRKVTTKSKSKTNSGILFKLKSFFGGK